MALTIAIADDNADGREILAALMRYAGHIVHCESEGHGTLRCLEKNRPDIAILDIGMPGLNGLEVVAAARAQPWGRTIVYIAVTGYGGPGFMKEAKRVGFDHYLTKPVDPAALDAIVADVVTARRESSRLNSSD